jgi:hypothetical protein
MGMGMPRGIAAAVRIIRIHALRQGAPASGHVAEVLEKRSTFAHNPCTHETAPHPLMYDRQNFTLWFLPFDQSGAAGPSHGAGVSA